MKTTLTIKRAARLSAAFAVVAVAACSKGRDAALDPTLSADLQAANGGNAGAAASSLELAPAGNKAQVVVSALEGGPTSAPKRASVKPRPAPTPKPAPRVASARAPEPAPAPVQSAPIEAPAPEPIQQAPAARPTPVPAPVGRQPGVYKTEAEIFRQLPGIKP
jgi:hypothetical protein